LKDAKFSAREQQIIRGLAVTPRYVDKGGYIKRKKGGFARKG